MGKYGYVDVEKLCDCARNQTTGLTANHIMRFPRADVQSVDSWISVDKRLPENNKIVLCYCKSTTGEGNTYMLGALSNDEFWFFRKENGQYLSFPNLHLKVLYWQPLPEPPKES